MIDSVIKEAVFSKLIGQPVKLWDPDTSNWKPDVVISSVEQYKALTFIQQFDDESRNDCLQKILAGCVNLKVRKPRFSIFSHDVYDAWKLDLLWRECCKVEISAQATVGELRSMIEDLTGLPGDSHSLWCNNRPLVDDNGKLHLLGVGNGSRIEIRPRLRGGSVIGIDKNLFDDQFNFDFTRVNDEGSHHRRGGEEYHRPIGWKRYAITVLKKYGDEKWLGMTGNANVGEWAVSYHGTKREFLEGIITDGYDPSKTERNARNFDIKHKVYSSPFVHVAEAYAEYAEVNGQFYKYVFQNRINPKEMARSGTGDGEYWGAGMDTMRPYGILVKKK